MEVTRDLYSLALLAKLLMLHRQILFSLAIAAKAFTTNILEEIPTSQHTSWRNS